MGKMSAAGFIEPFHNSQHGSIEKGLKQPPQAVPTIIYTSCLNMATGGGAARA